MGLTLDRLRSLRDRAGLFLDFDGSLADIAPTPREVTPVPGAVQVLRVLTRRYALVAVVTGRPEADVRAVLPVDGLELFGVYGLERDPDARSLDAYRDELERLAGAIPGVWVEDKGVSMTVHYRQAPDPDGAAVVLGQAVEALAERYGLVVLEGKRAIELTTIRVPGKGAVVRAELARLDLRACLYAGDDLADLDAFLVLEQLAVDGLKVAVQSDETPHELLDRADLVVEGPAGLVALLRELAA